MGPGQVHSLSTVAQRILFLVGQLGKGSADVGENKDWIIAEPVRTARVLGDHAMYDTLDRPLIAVGTRESDDGNEVRVSIFGRDTLQHLEEQLVSSFWRLEIAEASRMHTRSTVQRIDAETRIVGNCSHARGIPKCPGLEKSVLGEGRANLVDCYIDIKIDG